MKIYTGESLAEQLTIWGLACDFVTLNITPHSVIYHFNLKNILQVDKIKKTNNILSTFINQKTKIEASEQAHFKIIFDRKEKQTINITRAVGVLTNAPPFSLLLGVDENNKAITKTLDELTHILVAGTTGSGKSVLLNILINSLICYNNPEKLAVILIDLKQVEFLKYQNIPHLATNIITTHEQAEAVLSELVEVMEQRYLILSKLGRAKNCGEFKKIVVVIDELSDLILQNNNIKNLLVRLLQKSRAAGIHFILATQSPRAKILDGVLLANLPTKIALTCASVRESVLILGHKGAETLTGCGDMLLKIPTSTKEQRLQSFYISDKQIKKLLNE